MQSTPTPTPPSAEATEVLAERFFSAIERADLEEIRGLYAPDVRVWHNVTGRAQTREENLQLLSAFTRRVHGLRYEEIDRHCRPDGFSQRHTIRGKLESGEPFELGVALFVNIRDGAITELWEYLDSAGIEPVFGPAEAPSPSGPLSAQLGEIEQALDEGRYSPGPWTRLLEACAAAPRGDVAALADRISAASDRLHARNELRRFRFETASGLELLGAAFGLLGLAVSTLAGSGLGFVVFAALLAATLQPVVKLATGLVLGFSFSYAYLLKGEPRFKLRFGPYCAAERWRRVAYHASGLLGSPLAWLLAGAAARASHPAIAALLLGLSGAHLLFQLALGAAVLAGRARAPLIGSLRRSSAGAAAWEWRAGRAR